jgi:hypothetical protein
MPGWRFSFGTSIRYAQDCNMIRRIAASLLMGLAVLFGIAFHERYWRWRDCFNELGHCCDPQSQDVLLEQAGFAWGQPDPGLCRRRRGLMRLGAPELASTSMPGMIDP